MMSANAGSFTSYSLTICHANFFVLLVQKVNKCTVSTDTMNKSDSQILYCLKGLPIQCLNDLKLIFQNCCEWAAKKFMD